MIPRPLDQIEERDLIALRDTRRIEDRRIEYKARLPEGDDPDVLQRERLQVLWKPIASFANTDGGDLILGIIANGGVPNLINGIAADPDRAKQEIETLVRSGISPRVRLLGIQPIPLANGNVAFVVRVPKSWSGPHRVEANAQFYYRTSTGAREMDVATLRREFLLSDSLIERARAFFASRHSTLFNSATNEGIPVKLGPGARTVLHIVPVQSYADPPSLTPNQLRGIERHVADTMIFGGSNPRSRLTFEGLVIASGAPENKARAYLHLYRNGSIECVITNYQPMQNMAGVPSLEARPLEGRIVRIISQSKIALAEAGIFPPFLLSLGLFGAANLGYLPHPDQRDANVQGAFRSHRLVSPELVLQDETDSAAKSIRPAFDALWNELDVAQSPNFGADGEWLGQLP